jgi:hypothetical protein
MPSLTLLTERVGFVMKGGVVYRAELAGRQVTGRRLLHAAFWLNTFS